MVVSANPILGEYYFCSGLSLSEMKSRTGFTIGVNGSRGKIGLGIRITFPRLNSEQEAVGHELNSMSLGIDGGNREKSGYASVGVEILEPMISRPSESPATYCFYSVVPPETLGQLSIRSQ